jgi:ribosomal-protein-serine acetyltransferase
MSIENAVSEKALKSFSLRATDRIQLRLLELQHAAELFRLTDANRGYLRTWLPWLDSSRKVEDTSTFIAAGLRQFGEMSGFHAGIWFDDQLCGVISHHRIDWLNRATSLGYWLDASHQGRGVMTESCRAMTQHAFETLGMHRVVIRCATGNLRSRAIPERLRFKLEGVEREAEWIYDHFVDLAVYASIRPI